MKRLTSFTLILLGGYLLAACSASPYLPEKKFAGAAEKRLVRMSGSRIPQMIDPSDSIPATRSPLTVITRDQIDYYGARSLSELLGNFTYDYSGGGR